MRTLQELVDAAAPGATIVLGDDVVLSYSVDAEDDAVTIDKDVTIDFNGHELTATGNHGLFSIAANGSLTLENAQMDVDYAVESNDGTFVMRSTSGSGVRASHDFIRTSNGDVTIDGGTFACDNLMQDIYGTVTINGGSFECAGEVLCDSYEGSLIVAKAGAFASGGKGFGDIAGRADLYDIALDSDDTCIDMSDSAVVNVYGGTYGTSSDDALCVYGTVNAYGGAFTAADGSGDGAIYVSGGTFAIGDGYCASPEDWQEAHAKAVRILPRSIVVTFESEGTRYATAEGPWNELSFPEKPKSSTGATFLYWEDSSGAAVPDLSALKGDATLHAVFSDREQTVTFEDNGVVTTKSVLVDTPLGKVPGLDRIDDGDGFSGWLLDGRLVDASATAPVRSDLTLTASYKGSVRVTFDDGGALTTRNVLVGTRLGDVEGIDRKDNGDGFYGWLLDGAKVDAASDRKVTRDVTLTARYATGAVAVSSYQELQTALGNGSELIELVADIPVEGTLTVDHSCTIVSQEGSTFGLIRPDGFTGTLLSTKSGATGGDGTGVVTKGTTVTLEGVLVDGRGIEAKASALTVDEATTLVLSRSTLRNNVVAGWGDGGGINAVGATLVISESVIQNNSTGRSGGGVYAEDTALHVVGSQVSGNKGELDGGGILWSDESDDGGLACAIEESSITDNSAGGEGGGLCLNSWRSGGAVPVQITDSEIARNSAYQGGGINPQGAIVNLNGTAQVTQNKAQYGGGVYSADGDSDDCQLIMNDSSSIAFNEAEKDGGGVCLDEIYLRMNDASSIHDNVAGGDGGGVYAASYGMDQLGGRICDNTAGGFGGGVYVRDDSTFASSPNNPSMMYDNTAAKGGDDLYDSQNLKGLYASQPSRPYGEGKSRELGTVLLAPIVGYGEGDDLTGINVPYYGWFEDNEDARYVGIGSSSGLLVSKENGNEGVLSGDKNDVGTKAIWFGLVLAYDANYEGCDSHVYDQEAYSKGSYAELADYASRFASARPGYVFVGWNTAADGSGSSYDPGDFLRMSKSTVLFAQWRKVTETGTLTIGKIVTGGGDPEREFEFTVFLSAEGPFEYRGSKDGTIASGGTILLRHGESVTIELPAGTAYRVVEAEAEGYDATPSSRTFEGTVTAGEDSAAAYVNEYVPHPTPSAQGKTQAVLPSTGDDGVAAIGALACLASTVLLAGVALRRSR